ncbi:winged helix-turn-helix domain-containing protein [Serinibacter arcticus]|uniref:Winged helix-turn-helix domain-containing protein n=1 Tax=Serinibacter arcticus TaxID=1655435 RepID=A0A2U1ZY08_9MICO|nr:crosslink repair DNA glycosylase YcaQ family protein [Serinibacter arcticus]PWD51802.1 winged helix-turn-helix domain-containing protein [Serinibacter arcticus]
MTSPEPVPLALDRQDARRLAIRAQLLTAARPDDVLDIVRHLTFVQLNPTAAIAPSADLVLWSRLGSAYDPDDLTDAVARQRVVDLRGELRVAEDVALFRAEMDAWPGADPSQDWQRGNAVWVADNETFRLDLLEALRADGPLAATDLPDTCVRPWRSSGWLNHQNVTVMLGFLVQRGEVAVSGWEGRTKLWDLASRVYPDQPYPSLDEAWRLRDERRLQSLGIARATGAATPGDPLGVGKAGVPATIDGVRGTWRIEPGLLDEPFEPRAALLSPFDRLLADRKRMVELFEFDYALEMFRPAAKRRWGYYALPVLWGDRLIGKLDATADRAAGLLRIHALHEDEQFVPEVRDVVSAEIDDLARWLGLRIHHDS